jgi:tetratricopeptide (TPR) repeat protein
VTPARSSTISAATTFEGEIPVAKKWGKFPYADKAYAYDAAGLKKNWPRLHRGDCEPFPKVAAAQDAWRHYHAGEFVQAVEAGTAAGGSALNAAIKAQVVYATYLEKSDRTKLELLEEAMSWAERRRADAPKDPNAHYFFAFAAGRYGQGISVAKALAQGLGSKVRDALLAAIKLEPKHADAHIAYGSYQAEVIDKVGSLVAGMTYGAKKDSAIEHFQKALKQNADSAIARVEYANGLILLFGKARIADAEKLYKEAAACTPADAMERLDVELARSELA